MSKLGTDVTWYKSKIHSIFFVAIDESSCEPQTEMIIWNQQQNM